MGQMPPPNPYTQPPAIRRPIGYCRREDGPRGGAKSASSSSSSSSSSSTGTEGWASDELILPLVTREVFRQTWEDAPAPAPRPEAILIFRKVGELAGTLVQFEGQRWRAADAWACPIRDELEVDPSRPDELVCVRITDLVTGQSVTWLSPEQAASWQVPADPPGPAAPPS